MSTFHLFANRILTFLQCLHPSRPTFDQKGQSTAEYGVVILIAIALAGAVLMMFTGGTMDDLLQGLLTKVLQTASGMIKAS